MLNKLMNYRKGYLRIRVHGIYMERFLNACRHRGIYLWGIKAIENAYEMNIKLPDLKKMKSIIKKNGVQIKVIQKCGLPFFLFRYRKRKLFFSGICFCIFLFFLFSQFLWKIEIHGNQIRTDDAILKALKKEKITNGVYRKNINCTKIARDLRKQFDDIIWVSASLTGTKLLIQIKENEDAAVIVQKKKNKETNKAYDIVSDYNCTIQKIIVRNGIAQIKQGDTVKKGQILVSGEIPIFDDSKTIIDYAYRESDADIIGRVHEKYQDDISNIYLKKEKTDISKEEGYIKFGAYRLAIGGIKNKYKNFEYYGTEKQLKILDDFYLPVYYGWRKAVPYIPHKKYYSKSKIQQILTERFLRYCVDLEKKGVEIIENDVKIYRGSTRSTAIGELTLQMPVGKIKDSALIDISKEQNKTGDNIDGNDGSDH